ncbi:MAG: response regulator [Pseudomonadota bacterium]
MGRTALLVEDNALNCKVFLEVLRASGFEVIAEADGMRALSVAEERRPDLALIDLQIPGLAGIELIRRLRASRSAEDLPLIAVSAHALTEDGLCAYQAGADLFLRKPVDVDRLRDAASRLAEKATLPAA